MNPEPSNIHVSKTSSPSAFNASMLQESVVGHALLGRGCRKFLSTQYKLNTKTKEKKNWWVKFKAKSLLVKCVS